MKIKWLSFTLLCCMAFWSSCTNTAESTEQTAENANDVKVVQTSNTQANKKSVDIKTLQQKAQAQTRANAANAQQGDVNWISIKDLEAASKKEKRKVMVDLYTSWCGWCKKMDKATFAHEDISKYLNEKFYAVKFDAEMKDDINFKGAANKFVPRGRKGYNELAHKFANGRMSYPTIAFLDEDLNRIESYPGYKQPHQFDPLLKYIDGGHYKSKSLAEFQQTYQPVIAAPPKSVNSKRSPIQVRKNNKGGAKSIQVKK